MEKNRYDITVVRLAELAFCNRLHDALLLSCRLPLFVYLFTCLIYIICCQMTVHRLDIILSNCGVDKVEICSNSHCSEIHPLVAIITVSQYMSPARILF